MAEGLTVPGRPPTPSDGRAQHYLRIGNRATQRTRTFANGTTLTFGPDDQVDTFRPGDAFYEQVLVIECAISDIQAVRDRFPKGASNVPSTGLGIRQGSVDHLAASGRPVVPNSGGEHYKRSWKKNNVPNTTFLDPELLGQSLTPSASVYMSSNRSNSPGLSHPGFSTDTRGPSPIPGQAFDHQWSSARPEHPRRGGRRIRSTSRKKEKEVVVTRPPPSRPSMSKTEKRGMAQYLRSREILDSTLFVPRGPYETPGPPRLIRINPPSPSNFGTVIDMYGPEDSAKWEPYYANNLNPHSGGMSTADRIKAAEAAAAEQNPFIHQSEMPFTNATNFGSGGLAHGKGHKRQQSDDQTIIFFNEDNRVQIDEPIYAKPVGSRYRGYSINGKLQDDRSETSTPPNYHRGIRNNPYLGSRSTPGSMLDLASQRSSPITARHSSLLGPGTYGSPMVTPPARSASAMYYRSMT